MSKVSSLPSPKTNCPPKLSGPVGDQRWATLPTIKILEVVAPEGEIHLFRIVPTLAPTTPKKSTAQKVDDSQVDRPGSRLLRFPP